MSMYGSPFPSYSRAEIDLEKIRREYAEKGEQVRRKRERLEAEAEAAYARYAEPHPAEVKAWQEQHEEFQAEADAIMNVRMGLLYLLGYRDVDLMTAWERLPSEISEVLDRWIETEVRRIV